MRDTSARRRRAARLALVAPIAALTLTACGDDDDAAKGMVVEATVE